MSTGLVLEVSQLSLDTTPPAEIEIVEGGDLQARYDRLAAQTLREGTWLTGPGARQLPPAVWDLRFARYREQLEQVRRLGDQLRPQTLRERTEPLSGDALTLEVMELFAA
jgi:hypothetical protein